MTKNLRNEAQIHKGEKTCFEIIWDFVFSAGPKAKNSEIKGQRFLYPKETGEAKLKVA